MGRIHADARCAVAIVTALRRLSREPVALGDVFDEHCVCEQVGGVKPLQTE